MSEPICRFKVTPITVSVHSVTENPIFGEGVTKISLEDDAAGPYIVLTQNDYEHEELTGKIRLDDDEIEVVMKAAKDLLKAYPNAEKVTSEKISRKPLEKSK